ncbi:MAG TPA: DUF2569 domain-containing protein [Spirochaetia bacterium]|nr:MAG: hypothetical protein A2Y41_14120 [Spirochaetes bacterium GWB1_36_13]HCL57362.1 DUF2569 domain-containing protein [Spirochaetia bacterium]
MYYNNESSHSSEPEGIGGWLILPAIGLCLAPFRILLSFIKDTLPTFSDEIWIPLTQESSSVYHPLWKPLLIAEAASDILLMAIGIVNLILFFQKKKFFVKMIIITLISTFLFNILDIFLVSLIPQAFSLVKAEGLYGIVRSFLAGAIWIPYFLISKRVKNTFTE